ncbi:MULTISPECIES: hypothetical protein [Ramlibacter]|uniref:hypothetical protein n=1 Tax=Ramlibacter TaxID=174951 RepID=UPI001D0FFB96|nr:MULTISPECIES: hypothetical protein [Ramlibacter]
MKRRLWLQAACAGAGLGVAGAATAATLPAARSLPQALQDALARRQPLVAMASLEGCPFCRMVRDSYLAPLQREQGLAVVQLDMDSRAPVTDFAGQASTQGALLRAWRVDSYPTLLFFGRAGVEAAPRLVGASIPDFYGAYLDERLRLARRNLA